MPKLRFKGFQEDWEQKKLGEVVQFLNGKAHEKDIKVIGKYVVINSKFISTNGLVRKYSDRVYLKANIDNIAMVMSDVPKGKAIAKCFYIRKNNHYTINQRICLLIPIMIQSKFLFYILDRHKYYLSFDNGVSQTNLRKEDVLNCLLNIPKEQEQKKIANFLNLVDKRLEKIENKKRKLEEYKKGMMQKIFKQQIRFKDKNSDHFPDWQEKKLGEMCLIITGKLNADAVVKHGKYRFYTCAKDYFFINKFAFDTNALIISGNGAHVGYVHHYNGKFNAYQRTYILDGFREDIYYLKYFLEKNLGKRISIEKKDGNIPYIVLETLAEMIVFLPIYEEQKKIANFISEIEKKIELMNKKIEKAKEYKKGLLQQMFV